MTDDNKKVFSKKNAFGVLSLLTCWLAAAPAVAGNQTLSYSGRLTNTQGKPLDGPVDISVRFWSAAIGGTQLGQTLDFPSTALAQGVFQLNIALKPSQVVQIFSDGSTPVFIELAAQGKAYPRQQFLATPFALRVPTNGQTLTYDSNGELTLSLTSQPQSGQFLTKDGSGNLAWGTPSPSASQINNKVISTQVPVAGQALVYDGSKWTPQTTVSSLSPASPLAPSLGGTGLSATPANGYLPIGNGSGFTLGALSAGSGINVANSAGGITISTTVDPATKLGLAGGTLSGPLVLPTDGLVAGSSQLVLSGGNVGIGTSSTAYTLDAVGTSISGWSAAVAQLSSAADDTILRLNNTSSGGRVWSVASSGGNSGAGSGNFSIIDPANNTARMVIDPNGHVGIGMPDPEISLAIGDNDTGLNWISDGVLSLTSNAVNALTVTSYNIGIGTTGPEATLEVNASNSGGIGPTIQLNNDQGATGTGHAIDFTENGNASWTQKVGARIFTEDDGVSGLALAFATKTGNGTPVTERMRISSTGNVGIGTTNPTDAFVVMGSGTNSTSIDVGNTSTGGRTWAIGATGSANSGGAGSLYFYDLTSGHTRLFINTSGNVGIGTNAPGYNLHVIGTAGLSTGTSWTNASDRRLKDIDGDYEYGLSEIKRLHTVRFRYKEGNALNLPTEDKHTGFIAQEVRQVIPDAVHERADGYLELNVDPIHWATVNAVQELAQENDQLKAAVAQLTTDNLELKAALCSKFADLPICRP